MNKLFALCICLISCSIVTSSAQSLSGTRWIAYDNTFGIDKKYFSFGSDTISYSTNQGLTFAPFSIYHTDGNLYWTLGLKGAKCDADTGVFEFTISADTLRFSLVKDECPFARKEVYTLYTWVKDAPNDVQSEDASVPNSLALAGNTLLMTTADERVIRLISSNGSVLATYQTSVQSLTLDVNTTGFYIIEVYNMAQQHRSYLKAILNN